MANIFLISDTHFGHENSWAKFKRDDGSPLRPFTSTEQMDEVMIDNWNKTVKPSDHCWHLGDVVIKKDFLYKYIPRLNGHKRLVRGNHDIFDTKDYMKAGFTQIYGVRVFEGLIMSHIPLHPDSVTRFKANVHGHTHANNVRLPNKHPDPRYFCVCVEQINYTPIALEDVRKRLTA